MLTQGDRNHLLMKKVANSDYYYFRDVGYSTEAAKTLMRKCYEAAISEVVATDDTDPGGLDADS